MQMWREVLRRGIVPQLSTAGLQALRKALASDDSRLVQEQTTRPPPLQSVLDWPCEAACPIAFAGWQGDGIETVGEVEEYFARVCHEADDTERDEMRRELLSEIDLALLERYKIDAA